MKKLISVLLILAAFASCKKDDNKECQTKVLFYTNAQMIVNCGPFGVDVYVDDKLCGTLENAYSDKRLSLPCDVKDTDGSILAVDVEKGKHTIKAVGGCSADMLLKSIIDIPDGDCVTFFLDFDLDPRDIND